ncbi:serine/threonine-protein phosphatase [Candidatus Gracilibacteria bacterium]|nr:MAG: serine/threonine-protein phosphatase [Candidatus Gracilibacteria bacterium]
MFGFLNKKKKVDEANVRDFDSSVMAIKIYIALSNWDKARRAIHEIIQKEKDSLHEYLLKIEEKDRDKKLTIKNEKEYERKESILNELLRQIDIEEADYNEKIKKERFKVRFQTIEKEINGLLAQAKAKEAMILLNNFYEENRDEIVIIDFYKRQKAIIQDAINKKLGRLESRLKANAELEAMSLIGKDINEKEILQEKKEKTFFEKIKSKFTFWKNLQKKIKEKKLLDEINILIEEDSRVKRELAEQKLEKIHSGLVKELVFEDMIGYDLYGKILGADKISGDTFGIEENKNNYLMFLGDATGHGVKAGFIISIFNKIFKSLKDKSITDIYFDINNQVKQSLESKNFITGVLFEINKEKSSINYAGMGHEPILIYRKKTGTIEKKVLGGLAAGIRIIKDKNQIKVRNLELNDGDIMMVFSDGIVESKGLNGEFYSIDRLGKIFETGAKDGESVKNIYNSVIKDLEEFRGGTRFDDDATILLLKRNTEKDLVKEGDAILEEIKARENLQNNELKRFEGATKSNINKKVEALKKEKETKRIVATLEDLYYSGEILQLKQEAVRFIKEGYIDKKINFYLRKAIENENKYKIEQKNQKMQNTYNVLYGLYKKGSYDTVIKELEFLISRDGNI